jgi:hypothetical protein
LKTAASVIVSEHIAANLKKGKPTIFVHYSPLQIPVPVWAELVPIPALDQAEEAADRARAWGWVGRLVRQKLVHLLLARIPPKKIESMLRADFCPYVEVLFHSEASDKTGTAIYSTSGLATSLHI